MCPLSLFCYRGTPLNGGPPGLILKASRRKSENLTPRQNWLLNEKDCQFALFSMPKKYGGKVTKLRSMAS